MKMHVRLHLSCFYAVVLHNIPVAVLERFGGGGRRRGDGADDGAAEHGQPGAQRAAFGDGDVAKVFSVLPRCYEDVPAGDGVVIQEGEEVGSGEEEVGFWVCGGGIEGLRWGEDGGGV